MILRIFRVQMECLPEKNEHPAFPFGGEEVGVGELDLVFLLDPPT